MAVDSALRLGVTYAQLESALDVMDRWPHRFERELRDTDRRFGTDISDLAHYRPHEPRWRTPPAAA